ncbi:unnamed protein product, partial [Porites lobata]
PPPTPSHDSRDPSISRSKQQYSSSGRSVDSIFPRLERSKETRIGVRAGGGARGAAAPPNFGQLRVFGQREKIWTKPVFKDTSNDSRMSSAGNGIAQVSSTNKPG